MSKLKKILSGLWKIFVGAVFCQFLPTAILVVGWSYRAMQRTALRVWRSESSLSPAELDALSRTLPLFQSHATWPNWFIQQRAVRAGAPPVTGLWSRATRWARNAVASISTNLRIGFAGILNTSILMVLPAVLWQVGWYTGWDNSFNKGYEQYYSGIVLSWIGILLFLAAMLFLPMAQARQAITGEWRAFWDLKTVWRVSTGNPVRTLLLAAAFSVVALPINVLLIAPQGFENSNPDVATMTDGEFIRFLNRYYFWVCAVGFIGFIALRILAARWYAGGIVSMLNTGRLQAEALRGVEAQLLSVLRLDRAGDPARRHPMIAATVALSRPVWRTAVLGAAVFVWFTFVAQIYVREFIVYHPYRGFMNQPLVQLPWLRYVPGGLENDVRAAKNP